MRMFRRTSRLGWAIMDTACALSSNCSASIRAQDADDDGTEHTAAHQVTVVVLSVISDPA